MGPSPYSATHATARPKLDPRRKAPIQVRRAVPILPRPQVLLPSTMSIAHVPFQYYGVPTNTVLRIPTMMSNYGTDQTIRNAQMNVMPNTPGHVTRFCYDLTPYAGKSVQGLASKGSKSVENPTPNPQLDQKDSWASGKPLSLRLAEQEIGDPDPRIQPPRPKRRRMQHTGEANPLPARESRPNLQLKTRTSTNLRSKKPKRQAPMRIDSPTSFWRAFPKSGFRLWPCISLKQIRNKKFLSSCTDKAKLKLMSRYLSEHARDQLARCDPNSLLEPKWVLIKQNIYWKLSRYLLRAEECQSGDKCSCIPEIEENSDNSVGTACSDERCENRAMNIECVPGKCGSGKSCKNMRLQKREFAKVGLKNFLLKGCGLVALETIPAGTMVAEYLGDVISKDIFTKRLASYQGELHFYFMSLSPKLFIDASRRAGIARFINHSCDPNCIAEKWNAKGEPHVAIVAKQEIKPMEEITFSYQAQPLGRKPTKCWCGSNNCQGWVTPMPVSTMEAGIRAAGEDRIVASKIRRAQADLNLAEEILQQVYGGEEA